MSQNDTGRLGFFLGGALVGVAFAAGTLLTTSIAFSQLQRTSRVGNTANKSDEEEFTYKRLPKKFRRKLSSHAHGSAPPAKSAGMVGPRASAEARMHEGDDE
eukprot:CAMPEP_0114260306 /NCGR_PEP_ID=MMETSP0058-20121206/20403_1 /TAXON_ID=36894 /ORGANISM="Pyramimonas parkeae, CCMP726" /LENGTH=101 /DNA_ID=CAMNT_0001375505 /DNA_START=100 /DNA_END=402 /DNA_ORIENTATION=+